MTLPTGKLPNDLLEKLIAGNIGDSRVVLGPGVGADAALIDMGDKLLAAKTDPITFASDRIGWYAVHVNANDVACTGADPRWFLATILMPEGALDDAALEITGQIRDACASIGASLVGGHTEVTAGIEQPIVIGQMLGEVDRSEAIFPGGARAGDQLVLTQPVAIEGTAIIARECAEQLTTLDAGLIDRARALLDEPGISVIEDAVTLQQAGVHALHDPTEGGVVQAVYELSKGAGLGVEVDWSAVPVLPECAAICTELDLDPLRLIASGTLLAAMPGNPPLGTVIGEFVEGSGTPIEANPRDELARLFER